MEQLKSNNYSIKQYIETHLWIVNKNRVRVPFILNPIQARLEGELSGKDLVLKSRKPGVSTHIDARFLIKCLIEDNRRAVVISHEKEATKRLLERVYYFIDNLAIKPRLDKASESEIKFPDTNSSFYIGTAGSKAFGRGDDITDLHISELDWWENSDMLTGLLEACVPGANIVIETTGNGFNSKFHQLWKRAKNNQSDYKAHFFGWNDDTGNTLPIEDQASFKITQEEQHLKAAYKLTNEQLNWRRNKMGNMDRPELFPQEFPINDIEAFLSSGRCFFNTDRLQKYVDFSTLPIAHGDLVKRGDKIEFIPSTRGALKIWKKPIEEASYVIGADVAEGIGQNSNTAVVLDKNKDVVATLKLDVIPAEFGRELAKLGQYYNFAFLGVEVNNHGLTTLTVLKEQEKYDNLFYRRQFDKATNEETEKMGFRTTSDSKFFICDELSRSILDGSVGIPSKDILEQMLSFIIEKDGKINAQSGSDDDFVIATGIALYILPYNQSVTSGNFSDFLKRHNRAVDESGGYVGRRN